MDKLDSSNSTGTPLTEEQLAYFSESTNRAVHHALDRYRRGAVVGFLILLFGIGFAIWDTQRVSNEGRDTIVKSGRVVSVAGCNRDFHTTTSLRGVLQASKVITLRNLKAGRITADQAADQIKFYNTQLTYKLRLPDCRLAYTILTDDPDKLPPIPKPLFPKPLHPADKKSAFTLPSTFHTEVQRLEGSG